MMKIQTIEEMINEIGRETIEKMLKYYGHKTIEEYGEEHGYYNKKDSLRSLQSRYEEDILWDDEQ